MKLLRLLIAPAAPLLALFLLDPHEVSAQKKPAGKATAPAPATKSKAPAGKSQAKAAVPQAPTKSAKAPAKSGAGTKSATARRPQTRRGVVTQRRQSQQVPGSERVREIQQALADRGYALEPSGVWGSDSVEALKKFQTDQNINNLTGRGRLDPLTLIALGLGPKREPSQRDASPEQKAPTEGRNP